MAFCLILLINRTENPCRKRMPSMRSKVGNFYIVLYPLRCN
ncbi:hypothetical protein OKW27_001382 [Paraburkholderia sp. 35.1]